MGLAPLQSAWAQNAGTAAHAETDNNGAVGVLPEVVVTATRTPAPLSDLVADVTVVDRDTLERSGAQSVADVLTTVPGIEISRTGGPGLVTGIFLRGAETRFTAVYIDGVRVDSQATGGATWEAIPLAQIDHIEILRGPAAAVYGSDAVGGVIQLFTRQGEGAPSAYAGIGFGSYGTGHSEAGISGASGALDYSINVAHDESKGFNATTDAQRFNPDKDGYRSTSGSINLGWQIAPGQRLQATLLANNLRSQYDDYGYDRLAPADDWSTYRLRTAGLTWSAQWNSLWSTKLSVSDSENFYQNRPSFYQTDTHLRGYLFQNAWRIGAHLLTLDLERREDWLDNAPGQGPFASPALEASRSQNGLALGYGYNAGPHSLQINVRHDDDSQFGGHDTGSIAYGYSFAPGWRATASAGTSFRAPTLYQLYSEYGVRTLQPEEGINGELGLHYAQGANSASVVVYQNRVRNLIDFDYGATDCAAWYLGCYANVGHARYRGATFTASRRFGAVTLHGSIDVQDPRDLDTDKRLALRARVHGHAGIDWRIDQWQLGAQWQASGKRYADAANTQTLGGYGLIGLSASRAIGRHWRFLARIDNLANKNYQRVQGYSTPGRTFYVQLKWMP